MKLGLQRYALTLIREHFGKEPTDKDVSSGANNGQRHNGDPDIKGVNKLER